MDRAINSPFFKGALAFQYESARANYEEMADLADARRDPALKLAALIAHCIIHATHTPVFNLSIARELGQNALELALQLNDRAAEARALWCVMLVEHHSSGDGRKILAYGAASLAIARELQLQELTGFVLSSLAWAYWGQEQFQAALRANREAQAVCQALGNLSMVADTYTIMLVIHRVAGDYDAVLETGSEALRLNQSIDNPMQQCMALGSIGEIHATGVPDIFLASIARAKFASGKIGEGEAVLAQAFAEFDRNDSATFAISPLFVADAHLQLAQRNPEQALGRLETLIRRLHDTNSHYYLAEATWLQGRAWLALGDDVQARAALLEARAAATSNSERKILWQIMVELARLERSSGNEMEADRLQNQAQEIISYIADHAGSEELRASFLKRPDIRWTGEILR